MITSVAAAVLSVSQAHAALGAQDWRESRSSLGTLLSAGDQDNALVQLRCVSGGTIRAYLAGLYTGDGPEPRRVTVESGRARSLFRLHYGVDAMGGFSVDITIQSRVLVTFRRTGELSFTAAGAQIGGDQADPHEIDVVSAFLRRCGR